MSYSKMFCHLVWGTKGREPFIDERVEELLPRAFGQVCRDNDVALLAFGATLDHVHLVVRYPSRHSAADLARLIKGSSSHLVKRVESSGSKLFLAWQREYGAISIDESTLDRVIAYVRNQKQHHADNTLVEAFETLEKPYTPAPRETSG